MGSILRNPFRNRNRYSEGARVEVGYPGITLNNPRANALEDFPSNEIYTTKYSLWSYFPKVLYEQFRKFTSIYFLIVALLSLIPSISPIGPWTSWLGLLFILGVAMLREAWEDYLRLLADMRENYRLSTVLEPRTGDHQRVRTHNLKVGDLIHVRRNDTLPADIVVLCSSSTQDGICYIETSQLDGETNLKLRKVPKDLIGMESHQIAQLEGVVNAGLPTHLIYEFKGNIELLGDNQEDEGEILSISHNSQNGVKKNSRALSETSFLMRGAVLRNTDWIVGVVVYAGPETKLSLNQQSPPSKFSSLDKRINKYVVGLFLFQCVLCIMMSIQAGVFTASSSSARYLDLDSEEYVSAPVAGVITFFSYFIIMSYIIPLSLVVSMEITKVVQARFMEWDEDMKQGKEHMVVKTSNLNDELALVQHIFCDKTGTLTENMMEFRRCSARGIVSEDERGAVRRLLEEGTLSESETQDVKELMVAMSVCHSVVVDTAEEDDVPAAAVDAKDSEESQETRLQYKASSPDEEALCNGARENGAILLERNPDGVQVRIFGEERFYQVMCELPFTSARRRMSVLVRAPDGTCILYCKGADHVVYERLVDEERASKVMEKTQRDLDMFSMEGLRTLLFGRKIVTEEEANAFVQEFSEAESLIEGREEAITEVCDRMERNLTLLGCSAIEDRLQDGVPETIAYMLAAGIKVWVITGDKQETAINIGYSTRLLHQNMELLKIKADSSERCGEILRNLVATYAPADAEDEDDILFTQQAESLSGESSFFEIDPVDESKSFLDEGHRRDLAVIIGGGTLQYAIEDYPELFLRLTSRCKSVICNRVAPLQKALVVRLVREGEGKVCLAIGDGANDVSMIQEANIGVGIFGEEGTQAARSSDYALQRFKHLRRLVSIHGRYALVRNAALTHYSFYKNVAMFLVQIWFSFYCGASAQPIYDAWLMTFFNITITSLPPFAVGMFEKDIPEEVITKHPESYRRTQRNTVFTLTSLAMWMMSACYHSIIFFWTAYAMFSDATLAENGQMGGLFVMGNWIFAGGLAVLFCKFALEVETWNIIIHLSVWLSVLAYLLMIIAENFWIYEFPDQYGVITWMLSRPSFYLWLFACIVTCLLPDIVMKYLRREFAPHYYQLLQEAYQGAKFFTQNPSAFRHRQHEGGILMDDQYHQEADEKTPLLPSGSSWPSSAASSAMHATPDSKKPYGFLENERVHEHELVVDSPSLSSRGGSQKIPLAASENGDDSQDTIPYKTPPLMTSILESTPLGPHLKTPAWTPPTWPFSSKNDKGHQDNKNQSTKDDSLLGPKNVDQDSKVNPSSLYGTV